MKKLVLFLALGLVFVAHDSQARVGGGRSFGSRGSRSVSPRSAPMRSNPNMYRTQPTAPAPAYQPTPSYGYGGGSFLRSMAGGIMGGMLGSMLFRSMGWAGNNNMAGGGGGIGFFEIILLALVGFFAFRWFQSRRAEPAPLAPLPFQTNTAYTEPEPTEAEVASTLASRDPSFDITAFKEARVDDFFSLQAALMNREVEPVRAKLTDELFTVLQSDVASLRQGAKINRLENIAVKQSEIIEAWDEQGTEYATLRLKASLLDYTVDENTGAVIAGSKTAPVAFSECWTFARQGQGAPWKLSAIENMA